MSSKIIKASSIITMDPARPRAEAVTIDTDTGRITAVGSVADCQQAAGADADVTDLGDSVLLPGFIEVHSHPLLSGTLTQDPAHWIAPYVGYPSFSDVEKLWRQLDKDTPAGQPLLFNGLDRLLQQVTEPDAEMLDRYFPSRPIVVVDNSGHEAYFNTATMELVGWQDHKPPADPVGARYGRNEDGTSNGRAYETAAVFAVVGPMLAKVIPHPLLSGARWYVLMAKNGITATSDMTYSSDMLPGYEALASTADCPLRMSFYHMSIHPDCGDKLVSKTDPALVRKQGIKLWADGSPWVGTIANSYPFLDTPTVRNAGIPLGPGGEGVMNYTRAELDETLAKYAPMGWQMAFHVNGDVGLDIVLDAYERALVENNLMGTDHRWRVEHCGGCRGDQFQRAADMGVAISLGPFQFIYWGDLLDGKMYPPEIGAQWMRWGDAVRTGAKVAFHNDGLVSPPIPLLNIQAAITRATDSGTVRGPEQIISLDDALKAETIDAAFTLHRDDEIGSISVGKYADFAEVSKDPYDADPMKLASEVAVRRTWLAGKPIDTDKFLTEVAAVDPTEHHALHKVKGHC